MLIVHFLGDSSGVPLRFSLHKIRYGSFIVLGRGNPEWNNSAPHGEGRLFSRTKAKEVLTMEEFKKSMQGVYSSCISTGTLDESPMAYKNGDEIKE